MPTANKFPVKWMHSSMPRAPQLYQQTGNVIALLDALLVTGWGATTPQRIHVEGGIATVQCNVGDTFLEHVVIEVSGAEQTALNGQHRVLTSTDTGFTFATDAPNGYATGTISIKAAPAGWEKVFAGENKGVYRSTAPDANGVFYQIDDSVIRETGLRGYGAMSDVDTGDCPFPAASTTYIKLYYDSGSSAFPYSVFADQYSVVFCATGYHKGLSRKNNRGAAPMFFGAIRPLDGDVANLTHEAVCGMPSWTTSLSGVTGQLEGAFFLTDDEGLCGDAEKPAYFNSLNPGATDISVRHRILLSRCFAASGSMVRGIVPGVYDCKQKDYDSYINEYDVALCEIEGKQRALCFGLRTLSLHPDAIQGVFAVDITGPWR